MAERFACIVLAYPSRFKHLRQPGHRRTKNPETSATRLVQMALDFAVGAGPACILVLDAFFSVAQSFNWQTLLVCGLQEATGHRSGARQEKTMCLFPSPTPGPPRPWPTRKYGDNVKTLRGLRPSAYSLSTHAVTSWRHRRRVVLRRQSAVETHGGVHPLRLCADQSRPIVLMCSDLEMPPVTAD